MDVFLIKRKEIQDRGPRDNSEEGELRGNQAGVRGAGEVPVFIRRRYRVSPSAYRRLSSGHVLAAGSPPRRTFVSKMEMVEPFQYSQFLWVFSCVPSSQKQVALLKDG